MRSAMGLSFTKVVRTLTLSPRAALTVRTLLSALVAWRKKWSLTCTGWWLRGVIRTPMLVGLTSE